MILVSGGNGKLGQELSKYPNIKTLSKEEMDITNKYDIMDAIQKYNPTYFIHAGALTRPLSLHESNINISITTNIIGTANIVLACKSYNIKLIYISSDYVYPGIKGNYSINDGVLPFTNYGWSKLGGECSVAMYKNSLIIRIALCEYPFPHKQAYSNMYKSYIYHKDAVPLILKNIDKLGIINICGKKQSVYNFAKQNNDVEPIIFNGIYNNTTMSNK
jgi:dTDP-4-dehydrorhamnose reductase